MAETEPIIRLEQVEKSFNSLHVLQGVDLEIEPGRTTVIIGPSGCGKTVLLKTVIGLLRPDKGKVFFRDREISSLSERKLAPIRRRMGFLFQGSALFDSMTVFENVRFPMLEHNIGMEEEQVRRCHEVLNLVELQGMEGFYPEELSGGQKKRVALARAIVLDPEVMLYDEPTTGLDPIRADIINDLILKLQDTLGTTAVVVTHDMGSACKVGHRIVMLHEGHFIADTTPGMLQQIDNDIVARFVDGWPRGRPGSPMEPAPRSPDDNAPTETSS
jgi:phospholipid/cholesterol/gamma-HCH transport system ATP-binding protein